MSKGVIITKDSKFTFRINSSVREALTQEAEKEGMSLASFVNRLLLEELKRRDIPVVVTIIKKIA
jgi:hypothetical protein